MLDNDLQCWTSGQATGFVCKSYSTACQCPAHCWNCLCPSPEKVLLFGGPVVVLLLFGASTTKLEDLQKSATSRDLAMLYEARILTDHPCHLSQRHLSPQVAFNFHFVRRVPVQYTYGDRTGLGVLSKILQQKSLPGSKLPWHPVMWF